MYSYAVQQRDGVCRLVDTHVVPESSGGDGNGVIVTGSISGITSWLWKRLHHSGCSDAQSLSVMYVLYCTI